MSNSISVVVIMHAWLSTGKTLSIVDAVVGVQATHLAPLCPHHDQPKPGGRSTPS
jgi:hypothetical protein